MEDFIDESTQFSVKGTHPLRGTMPVESQLFTGEKKTQCSSFSYSNLGWAWWIVAHEKVEKREWKLTQKGNSCSKILLLEMKHSSVVIQHASIRLSPYAVHSCSCDDMACALCPCHTLISFHQKRTGTSCQLLQWPFSLFLLWFPRLLLYGLRVSVCLCILVWEMISWTTI